MGCELINSNQSSDRTAIILDALWRAGDILSAAGIKEYVILADESVREFGRDVNELRRLRATADERFLSAPRGQADKNLPKRARSFPFFALPDLDALLARQPDANGRGATHGRPHHYPTCFTMPAGARCSGQTSGRRKVFAARGVVRVLAPGFRDASRTTSAARPCAILSTQACPDRLRWNWSAQTESVYQRYDIVAERDLTDGVARYSAHLAARGRRGRTMRMEQRGNGK